MRRCSRSRSVARSPVGASRSTQAIIASGNMPPTRATRRNAQFMGVPVARPCVESEVTTSGHGDARRLTAIIRDGRKGAHRTVGSRPHDRDRPMRETAFDANPQHFGREQGAYGSLGWGTRIRTSTNGVRVRCSTVKLSPIEVTGLAGRSPDLSIEPEKRYEPATASGAGIGQEASLVNPEPGVVHHRNSPTERAIAVGGRALPIR